VDFGDGGLLAVLAKTTQTKLASSVKAARFVVFARCILGAAWFDNA
jgi:hypothetical protein